MKKEQNEMLIRQSRFILMGEMMANISHQWKQPLNTINLAVLSARTSDFSKEELEKYFDIIESNVNHLAATIDDFTMFLDKKTCIEPRNIDAILKEIDSIIGIHLTKRGINLEVDLQKNYHTIMMASSISQVILNLLNNSKDAFDNNAKDKTIKLTFKPLKNHLEICCCDNAKGISEDIIDDIFDPYFTTKEQGKGTGIGLYMTKQIIKKIFHGRIKVNSQVGKTCFSIILPYSQNCKLQEESNDT